MAVRLGTTEGYLNHLTWRITCVEERTGDVLNVIGEYMKKTTKISAQRRDTSSSFNIVGHDALHMYNWEEKPR